MTVVDASMLIAWLDDRDSHRLAAIGMTVSSDPLDPVALAHLRGGSRLRMPDCVVLACAEVHRLPVATFDEVLQAAASREHRAD